MSLPSIYNDYLDERVDKINSAINESEGNYDCFVWITDIHWEQNLNTRHSPAMIKYLTTKTGIDKVLNGGDTGNAQMICQNAIDMLRKALGSDRVYSVTGNHEMLDASKYEKPFNRVANTLRGHNKDLVYGDKNKSYFYFDDNTNKVRYIGLSVFGLYQNGACESTLNKDQLSWFENDALVVREGWTIVIFAHSLYYIHNVPDKIYATPVGSKDFINIIDSYSGNGKIACVLLGHSHRDRIHIGATGVPYIISACDRIAPYYQNGIPDINVDRIAGTLTEQHFEVVVINKTNKKVSLFSIGGNSRNGYDDDAGEVVDERVVFYN